MENKGLFYLYSYLFLDVHDTIVIKINIDLRVDI